DVYSSAHPDRVTRDGTALDELAVADFATAASGWTYDGSLIRIKFAHAGGATQLVINGTAGPTDGDDLGDPAPSGCGCGAAPRDAGWLLLAIALVVRRR